MATEPACGLCVPSPWWHLLDADPYMRRGQCGHWEPWQVAAWQVASWGLLFFYLAIALILLGCYLELRRRPVVWSLTTGDRAPLWGLPWASAFFVGCGGGHAMNGLSFVWPAYRLFVVWDWVTLLCSVVGAAGLWKLVAWGVVSWRIIVRERDDAVTRLVAAQKYVEPPGEYRPNEGS